MIPDLLIVNKAYSIMHEHTLAPITPIEISRKLEISYSNFRKKFKNQTGCTPAHSFKVIRAETAKHYLINSDMLIKEIAYHMNFDTPENFRFFFKKIVGVSPVQYRNLYKNT